MFQTSKIHLQQKGYKPFQGNEAPKDANGNTQKLPCPVNNIKELFLQSRREIEQQDS